MAVGKAHGPITDFEDWYVDYAVNDRDGTLEPRGYAPCGAALWSKFEKYKREMDARVANYENLIKLVDAEVISQKPDLPNVSSGETAGMIRRMARNLVQHTPNVEVISEFSDESTKGIFSRHILKSKIIGDDHYSNDMQQNLFASTKNALTLGFDAVVPVLLQDAGGSWYIKYDNIYYRDVFPEPGAKDVRDATDVFIRRYLTKGEVQNLVNNQVSGWDIPALKTMLKSAPGNKELQSVDHQTKKHHQIPEGYEIITWYSNTGEPFLTFDARNKNLLRIEKNKHPLKWHPVFFLVMEKDLNQPLGKSQVELVLGRQEFQDLMLNGAMKLWYRNINPSIIGYGTVNSIPNLSPGKYTQISNPNAKIEAFEVNTQTLMTFNSIATQNAGNMVQLVGAADQQMAMQGTGGQMSQTPQGVEAQQAMVDITTNNYQKAIEAFFSRYCSYALTIYFQELKSVPSVLPTADTREALLAAGMPADAFDEETGELRDVKFSELATEYFVRSVPGSLVELEDEKQVRILNEMFVPLSQAMPALAATQDPNILKRAALTMEFIIQRQLELSGSRDARNLTSLWQTGELPARPGETPAAAEELGDVDELELEEVASSELEKTNTAIAVASLQEQMSLMRESLQVIAGRLGVPEAESVPVEAEVQV